jgi:uncharacterized protein
MMAVKSQRLLPPRRGGELSPLLLLDVGGGGSGNGEGKGSGDVSEAIFHAYYEALTNYFRGNYFSYFRGSENLGNTCWVNATLQCLSGSPQILTSLHSTPHKCAYRHCWSKSIESCLATLSTIVEDSGVDGQKIFSFPMSSSSIKLNSFVNNLPQLGDVIVGRQEDASELTGKLIECLHGRYSVSKSKEYHIAGCESVLVKHLNSEMIDVKTCILCNNCEKGDNYLTSSFLQLKITEETNSINDGLQYLTKEARKTKCPCKLQPLDRRLMLWSNAATISKNPEAQANLGLAFATEGKDVSSAISWWKKAAEQGHAIANYNLGQVYIRKDVAMALSYWEKAAESGLAVAYYALAKYYGALNPYDEDKVLSLYILASNAGHGLSSYQVVKIYSNRLKEPKNESNKEELVHKAMSFLNKAIESGTVGDAYFYGIGTSQNFANAKTWYERELKRKPSDHNLMVKLAKVILLHDPTKRKEAIRLYEKASKIGASEASLCLAEAYSSDGVDDNKVLDLYKQAALVINVRAYLALAKAYRKRSMNQEAIQWFTKAAQYGCKEADYILIHEYGQPSQAVSEDFFEEQNRKESTDYVSGSTNNVIYEHKFVSLSDTVMISLGRFNDFNDERKKNTKAVSFSEFLSLNKFKLNPELPTDADLYKLRSFVLHTGESLHSGHYFTWKCCYITGLWYELNDVIISNGKTWDYLKQLIDKSSHMHVTMLCYSLYTERERNLIETKQQSNSTLEGQIDRFNTYSSAFLRSSSIVSVSPRREFHVKQKIDFSSPGSPPSPAARSPPSPAALSPPSPAARSPPSPAALSPPSPAALSPPSPAAPSPAFPECIATNYNYSSLFPKLHAVLERSRLQAVLNHSLTSNSVSLIDSAASLTDIILADAKKIFPDVPPYIAMRLLLANVVYVFGLDQLQATSLWIKMHESADGPLPRMPIVATTQLSISVSVDLFPNCGGYELSLINDQIDKDTLELQGIFEKTLNLKCSLFILKQFLLCDEQYCQGLCDKLSTNPSAKRIKQETTKEETFAATVDLFAGDYEDKNETSATYNAAVFRDFVKKMNEKVPLNHRIKHEGINGLTKEDLRDLACIIFLPKENFFLKRAEKEAFLNSIPFIELIKLEALVTLRELQSLADKEYMNDSIFDFEIARLKSAAREMGVWIFDSNIYTCFKQGGFEKVKTYKEIRARNSAGIKIDSMIIPIIENKHYTIVMINIKALTINIYDSFFAPDDKKEGTLLIAKGKEELGKYCDIDTISNLASCLKADFENHIFHLNVCTSCPSHSNNLKDWKGVVFGKNEVPQQFKELSGRTYDCGIHAISMLCDLSTKNGPGFNEKKFIKPNIPLLRRQLALRIFRSSPYYNEVICDPSLSGLLFPCSSSLV